MKRSRTAASCCLLCAVISAALLITPPCPPPACADVGGINLSGTWLAGNKGFFYITHLGDEIWWYGEDDPDEPAWAQTGHGKMTGKTITVDWINVPKGRAAMRGTVVFELTLPDRLVLKSETGHFGMNWMTMTRPVNGED